MATTALLILTCAAPAAARDAVIGPSSLRTDVGNAFIGCTGDTVSGRVRVSTPEPVDVLAVLLVRHQGQTYERTDRTVVFVATPGTTDYSFAINAAGLPVTVSGYKVDLAAGTGTATTNDVPVNLCAPATVVPEVPSLLLLPLSLALTGGVVVRLRRRGGRA